MKIEKLNHNGFGICYIDGKVTFVKNTLIGDEVEISIIKEHKTYNEAKVTKYITKSPLHKSPVCPYADKCGGCTYQIMSYEDELSQKQKVVEEILGKKSQIIKCDDYNYRNKITLKVKDGKIGFFEEGTHNLVSIEKCYLCTEKINKIIKELLTIDLSNIYEITIREGEETIVILYNTGPININIHNLKNADNILLKDKDYHILKGKTYITTNINKYKYIIEKDSFFQVNKYLTQKLYDKALEYLHPRDDDVLLDLYCGAGTIGIYLASSVERVIGIELNKYSIASANKNKILNNISNINFINEDVAKAINKVKMATKVVVDPPRKGLDKNTINNIKRLYPARIIYISCNVHTLARDIKLLEDSYTLENYTIVDMFKGTYHTEIVSVLQRNNYEERF